MASLDIGIQQLLIFNVAVQILLGGIYFVKLLNAVVKFGNVFKLELFLVNWLGVNQKGKVFISIFLVLELFFKGECLGERIFVKVPVKVFPSFFHQFSLLL